MSKISYCMQRNLCFVPKSWYCETCKWHKHAGKVDSLLFKDYICKEEPVEWFVRCKEGGSSNSETSFKVGEEDLPIPIAKNASWEGSFEVLDFPPELYDGFQAYQPGNISHMVNLALKRMPRVLQLTMQPRRDVWPETFPADSPSGFDISLYFSADGLCRSSKRLNCLLELMEKRDLCMQSCLDGMELLIFTSGQLPVESQRIHKQFYLWGIFLSLEGRNSFVDSKGKQLAVDFSLLDYSSKEDSASVTHKVDDQVVDMEIDMVGGIEVGRIDKCIGRNSRASCWENSDISSQDALTGAHSDQQIERSMDAGHLLRSKREQSDGVDVPTEFSRSVTIDLSDESAATSLIKMSPVAPKVEDPPTVFKLFKPEERGSSSKGLGMHQELVSAGEETTVIAHPTMEGSGDVEEEEDGLACMMCKEGYSLKPKKMLGIYSYSERVNLDTGTSASSRGAWFYSTMSSFNIIHIQCHRAAMQVDPKNEWKHARLRNNGTRCNCIFPLKGPSVPTLQYVRWVGQYWDDLNSLGQVDGNRLRLLTCDIVLMLTRLTTGASGSTYNKGGGRESNARFLPFMIQMAQHLADQASSTQRQNSSEDVQFMMVNSLLSES